MIPILLKIFVTQSWPFTNYYSFCCVVHHAVFLYLFLFLNAFANLPLVYVAVVAFVFNATYVFLMCC